MRRTAKWLLLFLGAPLLVPAVEPARPNTAESGIFFGGFSAVGLPVCQVDSRTRMWPWSSWISGAFHVGVWSNQSGSGNWASISIRAAVLPVWRIISDRPTC